MQQTSTQNTAAIHEQIAALLDQRAKALMYNDEGYALELTDKMIDCFTALGDKTPALTPYITKGDTRLWFAGFNRHGDAIYHADGIDILPDGSSATEQRGQTQRQRLAREHVARLMGDSMMGNPDELQGRLLSAPSFEELFWAEIEGEMV